YEAIEDIGAISCSDSLQNSNESGIRGVITPIGVLEERYSCPKCYSTDVECNDKTIKCITCKSRSLYLKDSIKANQIKLNITESVGVGVDAAVIDKTTPTPTPSLSRGGVIPKVLTVTKFRKMKSFCKVE
ncbi:unnamed protein product, partial [Rotaria socialis]